MVQVIKYIRCLREKIICLYTTDFILFLNLVKVSVFDQNLNIHCIHNFFFKLNIITKYKQKKLVNVDGFTYQNCKQYTKGLVWYPV